MENSSSQYYIQGVLDGNRRLLSKTITLIESSLPAHRKLAASVLTGLLPYCGKAVRLGITGVPGAGKSTFIETLGLRLANSGKLVAVLAVDPTSSKSGGSILGDKTRMEKLAAHENAFIRPSPAGRTLGGVAAKTREIMLVCEAAGYDVVLIETVGVGQSETTVASMVDFYLALMLAGAGDELQGIKKGLLEVADGIAINKADGENTRKAEQARQELATAMHMISHDSPSWQTPVLTCSAVVDQGLDTIWDTVLSHKKIMLETGEFTTRRKRQDIDWMWAAVDEGLKQRFENDTLVSAKLPGVVQQVKDESLSPTAAAEKLLSYLNRD